MALINHSLVGDGLWHNLGARPQHVAVLKCKRSESVCVGFLGCVFAISYAIDAWVLFGGGAEIMASTPGLWRIPIKNPTMIKLIVVGASIIGTLGVISMLYIGVKIPNEFAP